MLYRAYFTYFSCSFRPRKNRSKFHCILHLKQHLYYLVNVWQSAVVVIDAAIKKWRKRLAACVCANEQHFEHFL